MSSVHKQVNSPMPGQETGGPRSHQGPGSNYGPDLASPASSTFNKASTPAASGGTASTADVDLTLSIKAPEADSLLLTLLLSDTLLNVFHDHNFDSCTLCVCSNEGNVRGGDASVYLPPSAQESGESGEDVNCSCGFSAVANRRLAHQSGLFYEDESEVTGITEDLYYRKKPSLLLLDPKSHSHPPEEERSLAEKSAEVDSVPPFLLDLVHKQSTFYLSAHNALVKYTKQYLRTVVQPASISMVELMDGNDVIFAALDQVKRVTAPATKVEQDMQNNKMDETLKGTCLHKWTLLPAPGPLCSEDIIRAMKSLQPSLNASLHCASGAPSSDGRSSSGPASVSGAGGGPASQGSASSAPASGRGSAGRLSVQGPLTWRQFHRMAGPATKGNTDDQCEPLPVPSVTLGHEGDYASMSPLALNYWDSLNLEPYSKPRDVVYITVTPDNDFLIAKAKTFFKNVSNVYQVKLPPSNSEDQLSDQCCSGLPPRKARALHRPGQRRHSKSGQAGRQQDFQRRDRALVRSHRRFPHGGPAQALLPSVPPLSPPHAHPDAVRPKSSRSQSQPQDVPHRPETAT